MMFPNQPLCLRLFALLIVLSGSQIDGLQLCAGEADPLPIQRVQLTPERLAAEMDRVKRSVLTQMPRGQFEELVQRAARAEAAGKDPPRLIEAHYRATLEGDGLAGSAEWKVRHSYDTPGRFSLSAFQAALRGARWADKTPALLGMLDDKPGAAIDLLVDRKGERTLLLDWSTRGIPEPGGLRVDLRLPASAVTVLEVDMPADHVLQVDREEAVVSGPLPGTVSGRSVWRLTFPRGAGAGLSARLSVRRPATADQPSPLLRTFVQTTQRLIPGQVECEYLLDVQVQRGEVRQLTLNCDPGLRPLEVEAPGLEGWETRPAPSGGILVDVRLRDPLRGGRVALRALATLPAPERAWVSPGVRVAGGLSRGERIVLQVHPDLDLDGWKPGGFRPVTPPADVGTFQVIVLQSRGIGPEAGTRPEAHVHPAASRFQTRETLEWRIESERMTLTDEVQIIVRRGLLFQAVWQLPAGWEVEGVEAQPPDPDLRWRVQPPAGPNVALLTVEPSRPFAPGPESDGRRVILRLRAPGPRGAPLVAIPSPLPRSVLSREGTMTLRLGPGLAIAVPPAGLALRADVAVAFRGSPEGTLQLRARRGQLPARYDSEITLSNGQLRAVYQLFLSAASGAGNELLLYTSSPVPSWSWKTLSGAAAVRGIEPAFPHELPLLPAPPTAAGIWSILTRLHATRPGGAWWRLILDRPLQGPAVIELSTALATGGDRADIPLLTVNGAEQYEGRVVIRSMPNTSWRAESAGVTEEPYAAPTDEWARRAFTHGSGLARLSLFREPHAPSNPRIEHADLIIQPSRDGRALFRFRFTLAGWRERELPVGLPGAAELVAVRVNGGIATAPGIGPGKPGVVRLPWEPAWPRGEAEVVYALSVPALGSLARLGASEPSLPAPANIRRVWRLPVGVVPLAPSGWRRLPGGDGDSLRRLAPFVPPHTIAAAPPPAEMEEAVRRTPIRSGETIGAWLDRLAIDQAERLGAVVIDTEGLGESGLTPTKRLPAFEHSPGSAWEAVGFMPLAWQRGVLLTSRAQGERWGGLVPADAMVAAEEAAAAGQDSSGRFRSVYFWTGTPLFAGEYGDDGWADWEPVGESPEWMWVADASGLLVAGVAAGAVLAALACAMRRGRRFVIAAGLLGSGMLLIWLPPAAWGLALPVGAVALAFAAAGSINLLRRRQLASAPDAPSRRSNPAAAVPLGLALGAVLTLAGTAAPPGPAIVYLVPGSAPGALTALAPPELIESLRGLTQLGEPTAGAVLLDGRYEGTAAAGSVRWTARFGIHCFRDGAATLTVPLADAQLLGAEIDGREVLPRAGGEPGHFTFEVVGRGPHALTFQFDTPTPGVAERDVRFTTPELPGISCAVNLPAGADEALVLTARGTQRVIAAKTGPRLEADVGRAGVIHLRWRQPGAVEGARVPVQAVHLWDANESSARLLSVFRFRFGEASARRLEFEVPPGLELADVSPRHVDDPLGLRGLAGLKEWRQLGSRAVFEFQTPLSGLVQIELELVPRRPLQARPVLNFPDVAGDFERETFAAVRTQDVTAGTSELRGWEPMSPDDFLRERWQPLRVDAIDQEPVLAFHRTREPAALLRLDLHLPQPKSSGTQRLNWLVGPGKMDLQATATWSDPPPSGPVEWEVPAAIALSEVRGDRVRSWSRVGSRLQVWLEPTRASKPITLALTGSREGPADSKAPEQPPFAAVTPRMLGVGKQQTQLTVQAAEGWRLQLREAGPFVAYPTTELPGVRWSGFAETPGAVVFSLRPAGGKIEGELLTAVELAGRQPTWTCTLDLRVPGDARTGEVCSLAVEVRRIDGERPQWQLPPGVRIRETRAAPRGASWVLDLLPGDHRLTLSAKLPAGSEAVVPAVSAHDPADASVPLPRRVTLGRGLQSRQVTGLQPAGGSAWTVAAEDWQLRVATTAAGPRSGAIVQVEASPGDGGWIVRAEFTAFTEFAAEWSIGPPPRAEVLAARFDGGEIPRLTPGDRLRLASAGPGSHSVLVVWRTTAGINLPRLEAAGESVPITSASWTIFAQSGQRLVSALPPMSSAHAELSRAAAVAEFAREFGPRLSSDGRAKLQAALGRNLRRAEYDLAVSPGAKDETGPDGLPLADWLKRLRDLSPAGAADAGSDPPLPYAAAFERGLPHCFHSADGTPPEVRLESTDPEPSSRVLASAILVVLTFFGVLMTNRPHQSASNP